MKKIFTLFFVLGMAANAFAQYTNGIFMVNEDWYGHNSSTVNFYSYDTDSITYRVFQKENDGRTLGNTTEFGAIAEGKAYFCSKQNYSTTGGRFEVADAKSMKSLASFASFEDGSSTRGFLAVDAQKGYISTSKGVYPFNISNLTIGSLMEGTSVEVGDMVLSGTKVIAAARNTGLYIIDTATDKVEKTVTIANLASVFKVGDDVYVSVNNCSWGTPSSSNVEQFVKLKSTTYEPENTLTVPAASENTWSAWKHAQPAVDAKNNALYYPLAEGGTTIAKYDLATGTYTADFITFPTGEKMYGNVCGFDAEKNYIVAMTFEGYSSKNYHLHIYGIDGQEVKSKLLAENYWFPAMLMFAGAEEPSSVTETATAKTVASVTYVNLAGQQSTQPFEGVNIVVTTYTDGSHTAVKQMMK